MTPDNNLRLVNIVGSGSIHRELELGALLETLTRESQIESVKRSTSGLVVSFKSIPGKAMIYRSGSYTLMGSKSENGLNSLKDALLRVFNEYDILSDVSSVTFEKSNYVYAIDLNQNIDLNSLDIVLGSEGEYEPEQCSLLMYYPSEVSSTATVSSSGKCVINTPLGEKGAEKLIEELQKNLNTI